MSVTGKRCGRASSWTCGGGGSTGSRRLFCSGSDPASTLAVYSPPDQSAALHAASHWCLSKLCDRRATMATLRVAAVQQKPQHASTSRTAQPAGPCSCRPHRGAPPPPGADNRRRPRAAAHRGSVRAAAADTHVAEASFSKDDGVKAAKQRLLSSVAGTERGSVASPLQRGLVEEAQVREGGVVVVVVVVCVCVWGGGGASCLVALPVAVHAEGCGVSTRACSRPSSHHLCTCTPRMHRLLSRR